MRLSLTKEGDYAVRAMVWLAQAEAGTLASAATPLHKAAEIARTTGIPPAFAARVLARLQRMGLLHARAGQQGGYALARPAGDISLLEVIEAVEGPLLSQICLLQDSGCGGPRGFCVLHGAWIAAQEALRTTLARTSLASAIKGPTPWRTAASAERVGTNGAATANAGEQVLAGQA